MEETKKYELKQLTSKDIFPMVNIISKFGIDEFKNAFDPKKISYLVNENGEIQGDKLASLVGMNIAFDIATAVMRNLPRCENEIYEFLASISNLKRKELEALPMDEFLQMIIDVVQKDEFNRFFGVVSKLFK